MLWNLKSGDDLVRELMGSNHVWTYHGLMPICIYIYARFWGKIRAVPPLLNSFFSLRLDPIRFRSSIRELTHEYGTKHRYAVFIHLSILYAACLRYRISGARGRIWWCAKALHNLHDKHLVRKPHNLTTVRGKRHASARNRVTERQISERRTTDDEDAVDMSYLTIHTYCKCVSVDFCHKSQ